MSQVVRIVLTGADASGKSSVIRHISKRYGGRVLVVNEVATGIMGEDKVLPALGRQIQVDEEIISKYQDIFRGAQLLSEEMWQLVAVSEGARIIVFDRGIPDLAVYDSRGWDGVEKAFGMTKKQIFDRYDHVFVLTSLGVIDPEQYLRLMESTNASRVPRTVDEVRLLDEATKRVWDGHDGAVHFECGLGMSHIFAQAERVIDELLSKEIERKFLLSSLPDFSAFRRTEVIFQKQRPLIEDGDLEVRIRRQEFTSGRVELLQTIKLGSGLSRNEQEFPLEQWAFEAFWEKASARLDSRVVEKIRRVCLTEGGLVVEIDEYLKPGRMLVAEINFPTESAARAFELPSWMAEARDVTDDPRYNSRSISRLGVPALSF